MPESPPLTFQSVKPRAPEPLEEAVEKAVADLMKFSLMAYCDLDGVTVARSDSGDDLELPAVVVRASRQRESIPAGDVYEMNVSIDVMSLMDKLEDADPTPQEFTDRLWSAVSIIVEDPSFLTILSASRSSVRWHGVVRSGAMEHSRTERHATRTLSFLVHVSRLI
jgi:hypothetical protein